MKFRLETRAGKLIQVIDGPDMDPPPEALAWGNRFFTYFGNVRSDPVREVAAEVIYREAMLWYAPAPPGPLR